jgi:hypothetical protein
MGKEVKTASLKVGVSDPDCDFDAIALLVRCDDKFGWAGTRRAVSPLIV